MIGKACIHCGARVTTDECGCAGPRLRSSCVECGAVATRGAYCVDHVPAPKRSPGSEQAEYRKGYRDPAYYRERQATLNRARGRCERCGMTAQLQVDHIVPLRDGGSNQRSNLWALCAPCHNAKTSYDRRRRKA